MKTRIIESLQDFSSEEIPENGKQLLLEVSRHTGLEEEEIRRKSASILKSIIHNYAAFEVSTIDGFTHRVLRTFAKDLDLPVNFEVVLNTRQILLEAVESLISKAGTDETLTQILLNFALAKADDDKSWDITRDLFSISELLVKETSQQALALLKNKKPEDFSAFSKKLKQKRENLNEENRKLATEFFDLLQLNNLEEGDFSRGSVPKYFTKLLNDENAGKYDQDWVKNIASKPLYPKKIPAFKQSTIDRLQPEIAHLFEQTRANWYEFELLKEVNRHLVQLSLLNAINQELELIKKDRNQLLISEFNPRISKEVKNQPAPFIYERLGERYKHYFIDEFQDTSQLQWENLIPLIDHSLSGGENMQEAASLMLVGDAKQSIYRWRGGKAEQFIELYANRSHNPFVIEKTINNLPDNYRSGSTIVNFNNDFFKFAAGRLDNPEYQNLYQGCGQQPKKGDFGYANLSFIEAENKAEEDEIYPQKVLEIIQSLTEKDYERNDICILTRRRKEGVTVASFLSEHNVPVISSETLLIANAPEVNFINALLQFSIKPKDKNLKLQIFDFLSDYLHLEHPFAIISEYIDTEAESFFTWLKDYDIVFEINRLKHLNLYEAAEYIISSFKLIEQSNAYLQFYLDYIFEFGNETAGSLGDFLEQWKQDKDSLSIVVPEEENAVKIMTIHKSKGLEFPVVIYPYANTDFSDTKRDKLWVPLEPPLNDIPISYMNASEKMLNWGEMPAAAYTRLLHENQLDSLNVFYVACTRASSQLYILSKRDLNKTGEEYPNKLSGWLIAYLKTCDKWGEANEYEFGEIPLPKKKKARPQSFQQEKFYTTNTANTSIEIVTRSGALWDSKQEEAIEKGEILHEILAMINDKNDLSTAMDRAENSGLITATQREKISEVVQKIVSHPQLSAYYEPGIHNYNERDILSPTGERLRPDRLNFEENRVHILDYKTGKPDPKHSVQINQYAQALEEMGFETGNKIIVYTNKNLEIRLV